MHVLIPALERDVNSFRRLRRSLSAESDSALPLRYVTFTALFLGVGALAAIFAIEKDRVAPLSLIIVLLVALLCCALAVAVSQRHRANLLAGKLKVAEEQFARVLNCNALISTASRA